MNLPLYFALKEKMQDPAERTDDPAARYYTFGETIPKTDILIVTDSSVSTSPEEFAEVFCTACKASAAKGVFFDFEKPLSAYFVRFSELVINAFPDFFFLLPKQYAAICEKALILCTPCLPQNSWENFCRQQQKAYPNRWALELIPYQLLYECGKKAQISYRSLSQYQSCEGQFLAQAVCMSQRSKFRHLIYDTPQTLRNKLDIAEKNGCQLSIGLLEELRYYF
ncbi:MAG: hypothetical protein MJ085_03805 [Clostridia bacterium]|nr:hypothetical protein [Clostridia bacterium]